MRFGSVEENRSFQSRLGSRGAVCREKASLQRGRADAARIARVFLAASSFLAARIRGQLRKRKRPVIGGDLLQVNKLDSAGRGAYNGRRKTLARAVRVRSFRLINASRVFSQEIAGERVGA